MSFKSILIHNQREVSAHECPKLKRRPRAFTVKISPVKDQPDLVYISTAICQRTDRFSRRIGRSIVNGRPGNIVYKEDVGVILNILQRKLFKGNKQIEEAKSKGTWINYSFVFDFMRKEPLSPEPEKEGSSADVNYTDLCRKLSVASLTGI